MRVAPAIALSPEDRETLQRYSRGRRVARRLADRSAMVLLAAEGRRNTEIAQALNTAPATVARWRCRFIMHGVAGLEKDAPRPGRTPAIGPETVAEIVHRTTQETPAHQTHWSTRTMAQAVGVSASTVRRVWQAHGLKPHRVKYFRLSDDPHFAEKVEDIVGLYLNPPEHALVLALDEKTQIQALDRTQPGLPLKKGRAQTMTHDYKRHGTTTLFAALNALDGTVIGTCMKQHTHKEWLRFLRLVERSVPADREVHLIVDNYATHKHPDVRDWLTDHARFHLHFTPTYASWLNMVERFFRDLTENRVRRGVFRSVTELEQAITDYLEQHNQQPKPFIWTAKASDILEKVKRARAALHNRASV